MEESSINIENTIRTLALEAAGHVYTTNYSPLISQPPECQKYIDLTAMVSIEGFRNPRGRLADILMWFYGLSLCSSKPKIPSSVRGSRWCEHGGRKRAADITKFDKLKRSVLSCLPTGARVFLQQIYLLQTPLWVILDRKIRSGVKPFLRSKELFQWWFLKGVSISKGCSRSPLTFYSGLPKQNVALVARGKERYCLSKFSNAKLYRGYFCTY